MNILVIGDTCTDVFIYGTCDRICPEGPVPIFKPINKVENKGMAGNVYQNLLSLNIDNVDIITNHETITKTRYVEEKSNHLIVRVDENDIVENSFNIHNVDFEKYGILVSFSELDYNVNITIKGCNYLQSNPQIKLNPTLTYICN